VIENAPVLFTNAGELVRKRLIEIGEKYGYALTFYKTNTLKHGIPQFRPRTFALFFKGKYAPILHYYDKKAPHIIDYLKQIPKNASLQDKYVNEEWDISKFEITKYLIKLYGNDWRKVLLNFRPHLTTYNYLMRKGLLDDFLKFQKTLPDASAIVTKNVEHIKKKMAMGMGSRINYRVLELDKEYVYAVIGEMMGKQIHPVEDRLMNIREFLTLMSMPYDYQIENPKDYVKLSQNVPVITCQNIIEESVAIIKGEREFYHKSVLMQDNTKETYIKKTKSLF
jgi:site-specific DNA-cytosine methylase